MTIGEQQWWVESSFGDFLTEAEVRKIVAANPRLGERFHLATTNMTYNEYQATRPTQTLPQAKPTSYAAREPRITRVHRRSRAA